MINDWSTHACPAKSYVSLYFLAVNLVPFYIQNMIAPVGINVKPEGGAGGAYYMQGMHPTPLSLPPPQSQALIWPWLTNGTCTSKFHRPEVSVMGVWVWGVGGGGWGDGLVVGICKPWSYWPQCRSTDIPGLHPTLWYTRQLVNTWLMYV